MGTTARATADELTFLGQVSAESTTNGSYTFFSGTLSGLAPEGDTNTLIVAVLQSRDSGGTTTSPYSTVTINGSAATIRNRDYPSTIDDFNSCAVAYLNGSIGSSITVNVNLTESHEGQANIFLYKLVSSSGSPDNFGNSSNVATGSSSVQTTTTTASSNLRPAIVVAVTSNTAEAWAIASSHGTVTEDFSKDGGTTEFVTVASVRGMPSSTSVTFSASGPSTTDSVAIQAFTMDV